MEQNETKSIEIEEFEHGIDPKYKAIIAMLIGLVGTIIVAWILGAPLGQLMSNIEKTFVYHLIPFLFSITFFSILVYKAYIQDIKGLQFLAFAVLLHGLAEFLFVLSDPQLLNKSSVFQRGDNILASIGDLLFPIAVVMIYLHIEFSEKLRPSLAHAIGIIGTVAPMIVGQLLIIIFRPLNNPFLNPILDELQKVVFVYLGLFSLVILWVSIFGFRVMYGILRHADSPEIALSSVWVLVGFSSLLTNFLLLGVNYSEILLDRPLLFGGNVVTIHNTWLVTLALGALIMAYILSPQFAYAVPFDVYQLLVINQMQGITLFSFVNEIRAVDGSGTQTHDALKSPAIVAIQNLVREIASAEGHIMLIGMSDRIIVMKTYKDIVSVLIAQKNSYFLNEGLREFTLAFYLRYEKHINNFTGNTKVFHSARELVNQHMPFMRKESLIV